MMTSGHPEAATAESIPQLIQATGLAHAALIMDGNRRWAKQKHLPSPMGHRQGVEALKVLVRYAGEVGLQALTVFAFSTENWRRGEEEVGYLMQLFLEALAAELDALHAHNVRIRFMGDLSPFAPALRALIETSHQKTAANSGLRFQIAANYGGRQELVSVCRHLAEAVQRGKLEVTDITEETVDGHLYTAGLPDPDLLIRTGGESRLSNYLLWQSAYAEFVSTPVLWPDFTPAVFDGIIREYARRERRYGQ